MFKVTGVDIDQLAKAVIVWTGYESACYPTRNDETLGGVFSSETAARLVPIVKALEDEFYKSDAHITVYGLSQMGDAAALDFQRQYPDLPAVIAEAFAWCYTFDYK